MRGRFLVLEGIDGCGKTTQINHLAQWLPKSGLMPPGTNLQITREPGGTELGIALRDLLLNPPGNKTPAPLTELLLYAADRAQHVSELIMPTLLEGDWVLSDRFSGSTIAYQGYGRRLSLDVIYNLESIATQGLSPDMTLWLNIPIKDSLLRREYTPKDRIESEGSAFLERVAQGFRELATEKKWVEIQAQQKRDFVSKDIEEALLKNLI